MAVCHSEIRCAGWSQQVASEAKCPGIRVEGSTSVSKLKFVLRQVKVWQH